MFRHPIHQAALVHYDVSSVHATAWSGAARRTASMRRHDAAWPEPTSWDGGEPAMQAGIAKRQRGPKLQPGGDVLRSGRLYVATTYVARASPGQDGFAERYRDSFGAGAPRDRLRPLMLRRRASPPRPHARGQAPQGLDDGAAIFPADGSPSVPRRLAVGTADGGVRTGALRGGTGARIQGPGDALTVMVIERLSYKADVATSLWEVVSRSPAQCADRTPG